jgi:hypothetical protein
MKMLVPSSKTRLFSSRPARSEGVSLGAVIVVVILLLLAFSWVYRLGPFAGQGVANPFQLSSQTQTQACSPSSQYQIETVVSHYSGDSALTSPTVNYFMASNNQLVMLPSGSNPGSVTEGSPKTSVGTFSLTQGIIAQATATGAYPVWAPMNGNSLNYDSVNVFSTTCVPNPTIQNTNAWYNAITLIQAPSSGTSATTNTQTLVLSQSGSSLTTNSNPMPTNPTRWDVNLLISQPYRGALYSYQVYGTAAAPVTNYATGQISYNSPVTVSAYLIIAVNQTGISLSLDPSAPSGVSLTQINLNTVQAGTKAWLVGPLNGCSPAPASSTSSSPFTCSDIPIDIAETVASTGKHVAVVFIYVDNQQAAWILNNFSGPAPASFPTVAGASAGVPAGFSFLTPTSGSNSGQPSPLVIQTFTVIQAY